MESMDARVSPTFFLRWNKNDASFSWRWTPSFIKSIKVTSTFCLGNRCGGSFPGAYYRILLRTTFSRTTNVFELKIRVLLYRLMTSAD